MYSNCKHQSQDSIQIHPNPYNSIQNSINTNPADANLRQATRPLITPHHHNTYLDQLITDPRMHRTHFPHFPTTEKTEKKHGNVLAVAGNALTHPPIHLPPKNPQTIPVRETQQGVVTPQPTSFPLPNRVCKCDSDTTPSIRSLALSTLRPKPDRHRTPATQKHTKHTRPAHTRTSVSAQHHTAAPRNGVARTRPRGAAARQELGACLSPARRSRHERGETDTSAGRLARSRARFHFSAEMGCESASRWLGARAS